MFHPEHLFNWQYYKLNPHAIMPVVVATMNLILGTYALLMEFPLYWARAFFCVCLSSSLWFYAFGLVLNSYLPQNIFFWSQWVTLGMLLTAASTAHLALTVTGRLRHRGYLAPVVYLFALGIFYVCSQISALGTVPVQTIFGFVGVCFVVAWLSLIQYYCVVPLEGKRREIRFWLMAITVVLLSYFDIGVVQKQGMFLGGYIAMLGFAISVIDFAGHSISYDAQLLNKELQKEVVKKAEELNRLLKELRTTQLKLMEASKISAVAALSAGIIHQLSQPATAIHGFIRFIKQKMPQGDPMFKPVCLIEEQAVYLKDILENLMEVIRHRKIEKKETDIHQILDKALGLLGEELKLRNIRQQIFKGELKAPVWADPLHVQQVYMNIMVNAMDALKSVPDGQEKVISIRTVFDDQTNEAVVSFSNNGTVISDEDREQIFEPFFTTKQGGSGIGLALCKDLIAEHGGNIYVDCIDQQTTFFVRLPCLRTGEYI